MMASQRRSRDRSVFPPAPAQRLAASLLPTDTGN